MTPEIIEIPGELFRVLVRSRSKKGVLHLVDLESSECACQHWEFRVGPARRRGEKATDCYHLQVARAWFIERFVDAIHRQQSKTA